MRIISQRYIGDGQFMLQLGGLSSETKPTDAFVATGSQFFEDDTDAVFTFSGLVWNLEKNGQMKDLPVVTATDNGKILKVDNGVWSIGIDSGSSLPSMTGKNGKVLGVTLDAQEHEQIEWVTPSGGGAEKFVVTLTEENDTWTADKTVAEIVAADEDNQVVVCKVPFEDYNASAEIPCWFAQEGFAAFGGLIAFENPLYVEAQIFADGSGTEVSVRATPIPASTNAPLIVTLTESEGAITGDKTYQEVKEARLAGRPVDLVMEGYTCSSVLDVNSGESSISVSFIANGQLATATGAPTDYVGITFD